MEHLGRDPTLAVVIQQVSGQLHLLFTIELSQVGPPTSLLSQIGNVDPFTVVCTLTSGLVVSRLYSLGPLQISGLPAVICESCIINLQSLSSSLCESLQKLLVPIECVVNLGW